MDREKEEILASIEALQKELIKLNVKSQTFSEMIGYLRSRTDSVERKKAEIHKKIQKVTARVEGWTSARKNKQK